MMLFSPCKIINSNKNQNVTIFKGPCIQQTFSPYFPNYKWALCYTTSLQSWIHIWIMGDLKNTDAKAAS